ncbi:MAG: histidinol dehydrogenase [Alphaproteobacteria bacterium]
MPIKLNSHDADYLRTLQKFLNARHADTGNVAGAVQEIIAAVRTQGDAALFEYTRRFDRFDATGDSVKVRLEEMTQAIELCSPELMKSLKMAAKRIATYSEKQMPEDLLYVDDSGTQLGHRWGALDSVGLYVPGGLAAYPSSVLMNAIPAKVAGVQRLVMAVPAPEGKVSPAVLAAAHIAGVKEIYKVGGAQAIAALAYGTQTIRPVDKIVGPGNAYVAEAKRQVFGNVGIDMIAGPSEILVIADRSCNPEWIAADLLSQAEHDVLAQSILITDDARVAVEVEEAVERILQTLPRKDIAQKSWQEYGAILTVENVEQACELANMIAPEHMELAVADPQGWLPHIRHVGAIFLGSHTPEAIGDYMAGPSHVLPTCGSARFSSGLSVFDFLKRTSIIGCTPESFDDLAEKTVLLADTEGLQAHALSVHIRKQGT